MNKVDRSAVMELVEDSKITSMCTTTYFSAIAMSKLDKETGYPMIKKYTTYKLYQNMKDKMKYINESSVRLSVDRLIELGYFSYIDEAKTKLIIPNSGVGHIKSDGIYKSSGYITLHHCFFNKVFFDLSLRAKKMALILVCRLNNCSVKEINMNFKSKKNPENFKYFCKTLKVNRLAHIKYAIEELKVLFNIVELDNNTFRFSLNTISKAIVSGADKLFNFTQAQLSKTEKMVKESNKKNLNFKPKHLQEICEAVAGYSMSLGRKVIKELCKHDRSDVKNLLGYTQGILERFRTESV